MSAIKVFIGYDSREAVAGDVAAFSIRKNTKSKVDIEYLKHRELRNRGLFRRKWSIDALTGNWRDDNDDKPFSTEFSHTRFLIPALMKFKGWSLFMDSDMIFLGDVKDLFAMADDTKAVMVVKHQHEIIPADRFKMDGREQLAYRRKNWSSFVLWNCAHPLNRQITPEKVNFLTGLELHGFSWLPDSAIGELPMTYNYISGVSPHLNGEQPEVIHYTNGGPWFDECQDVPYGDLWLEMYENYQKAGGSISDVPTTARDGKEVRWK